MLHAHKTIVSIDRSGRTRPKLSAIWTFTVLNLTKANFVAFYCFEIGSAAIRVLFATPFIRVSLEGRGEDKVLTGSLA